MVEAPKRATKTLDWRNGWSADPLCSSAPRWSQAQSGKSNAFRGFRTTYLDHKADLFKWVPGPGRYKTDREFLINGEEEVDTNLSVQERAADYSIPRMTRAASTNSLNSKGMKRYLPSSHYTPGPGAYTQLTTFGAPSGPYRKSYFAVSKSCVNPNTLKNTGKKKESTKE